jgi:predicted RNase H-like HicB family nuclease
MTSLHYQVLVTQRGDYYLASVPDLKCEALGASPTDAVKAVRERALSVLEEFQEATFAPPQPRQLILAEIDLPAPRTHRARHLRLL